MIRLRRAPPLGYLPGHHAPPEWPSHLPSNVVYRAIHRLGGPSAVTAALGISLPTLARWRRAGVVPDARAVLTWAALVYPETPGAQLALARALAGCGRRAR